MCRNGCPNCRVMTRRVMDAVLSCLCFHVFLFPAETLGMEFRIYHQPQINLRMIVAEGRIQTGDADRFMALAKIADRDDEGLVTLILNCPGGNVEAAFRFVDAMDKVRVYTAVPNNASCASACASILFASGERRGVLGSGLLGFHSCYRRHGGNYVEDSLCNEVIAANAMQRESAMQPLIALFPTMARATWRGSDEITLASPCKDSASQGAWRFEPIQGLR